MSDGSAIEWTDATWNPITGCSVHSPGCKHCYAMGLAGTRLRNIPSREGLTQPSKAGPVWTGEVRFNAEWLDQPLRWRRPRMIFVCAHADLFHENVPDEWVDKIFAVMALCPQHTFQVLTKRADRMRRYLTGFLAPRIWRAARDMGLPDQRYDAIAGAQRPTMMPLPNVWLGVSAENQHWLMQRAPHLVETPAAMRFLSYEPALQPLDLEPFLLPVSQWSNGWANNYPFQYPKHRLDWVICGGESGPGARPMHPDWARDVRDQCAEAGVAFLFKQWGAWAPGECCPQQKRTETGATWFNEKWLFEEITPSAATELHCDDAPDVWRVGKKAAGRLLDGVLHDAFPQVSQ